MDGYVDALGADRIEGWSIPAADLSVWVNGEEVGKPRPTELRADADAAGHRGARGFFFRPTRYLREGSNTIEVRASRTTLPGAKTVIDFQPRAIVDDHWSEQYSHGEAVISRWWQSDQIIRHVNAVVCDEPLNGLSAGLYRQMQRHGVQARRAVSVGCGHGEKELTLLQRGLVDHFELYDLSRVAIERGRAMAQAAGVADRMTFHQADAFTVCDHFDLVFWNNALHHMPNVHDALSWSRERLRKGGVLAMDDYIGPSRMQFGPDFLDFSTRFRRSLPPKRMDNPWAPGQVMPTQVESMDLDALIYLDPSEAVDSANILPALAQFFPNAEVTPTGGAIYHLALNDILHNLTEAEVRTGLEWDDSARRDGMNQYAVALAVV
jgi:SAM-dependent methyltransferase